MAVKTHAEVTLPWRWPGRQFGALPWVRRRLVRLAAVRLPGLEVKAGTLLDRKGWRMIWSDARFGPVRQRLLQVIRATGRKESSS